MNKAAPGVELLVWTEDFASQFVPIQFSVEGSEIRREKPALAGDAASEQQPKFIAEPATEQELACPLSCANQAGLAWGSPRDCISVMQAVKYQLDPKATLNLEGFVGGV